MSHSWQQIINVGLSLTAWLLPRGCYYGKIADRWFSGRSCSYYSSICPCVKPMESGPLWNGDVCPNKKFLKLQNLIYIFHFRVRITTDDQKYLNIFKTFQKMILVSSKGQKRQTRADTLGKRKKWA